MAPQPHESRLPCRLKPLRSAPSRPDDEGTETRAECVCRAGNGNTGAVELQAGDSRPSWPRVARQSIIQHADWCFALMIIIIPACVGANSHGVGPHTVSHGCGREGHSRPFTRKTCHHFRKLPSLLKQPGTGCMLIWTIQGYGLGGFVAMALAGERPYLCQAIVVGGAVSTESERGGLFLSLLNLMWTSIPKPLLSFAGRLVCSLLFIPKSPAADD